MKWLIEYFTSSIGQKIVMGLTGLFLTFFLLIHLSGNLQLFMNDNGAAFNAYAEFMGQNPLIQFVSKVTFALFLLHAVQGLMLAWKNRQARGSEGYRVKTTKNTSFAARKMAFLGTIILVFLVIHLKSFWFEMKFGAVPMDAAGNKDLYVLVKNAFSEAWYVGLYIISMLALAYHLAHGVQSGFQSLGLNHKNYTPIIKTVGLAFAVVIPLAFAALPIYFFFVVNG